MAEINFLAVLIAAVAYMALGMAWYGPLMGKKWIKAMGWGPEKVEEMKQKGGMGKIYAVSFAAAILMAYGLAYVLWGFSQATGSTSIMDGIVGGFWMWLSFVVTTNIASVLWEGRSKMVYKINMLYNLIGLLVMGAVIASF